MCRKGAVLFSATTARNELLNGRSWPEVPCIGSIW